MTSEAQKRAYRNWIKNHPDKYKANWKKQDQTQKEKIHNDPVYRERHLEYYRQYRKKYYADPEHRKKQNEHCKKYNQKQKKAKLEIPTGRTP